MPQPTSSAASTARRLLGAASLIAVTGAALLAAGCSPAATAAQAPPAAPEVTVAEPLVHSVDVYGDVVGRFAAVQAVAITPQVTGRLAEVLFQDGQTVRAGEPLFRIDPAPFAAAVDQAEAEVARVRALGALAQEERRRAENLIALDAMSQEEFDRRAGGAEETAAAVRSAQARLEAARIDLGYTTILAPIDGRVSDRRIDVGNLVSANESLLTTVVSQDPIHIEFGVAPDVATAIGRPDAQGAGAAVQFRLEGESGFAHAARIDFVDNAVDPNSGVVRMRAVVENPDGRFAPGQFVRVQFAQSHIAAATLVPETAVSSDQNVKFVLVVNADNVVEARPIGAGPVVDGMRVVEQGLGAADRVVVGGAQRAYPGTQVTTTPGKIELAAR